MIFSGAKIGQSVIHSGWSYPPSREYLSNYASGFLGTMCINKYVRNGDLDIPNAEFCPTSGESGSSLMSVDSNSGSYSAEGILSFTKGCSKVSWPSLS